MRNRLQMPRKTLLLALGLLATSAEARAEITLVETVDVVPTSVVALPRSYYVPSSYVTTSSVIVPSMASASVYGLTPTSTYVPTRYYAATSAYVPTSYYATSYVARRPFRRNRYVETTYLYAPTVAVTPTYYVPSAYVPTAVVTSSLCCETAAPAVAPAAPARSSRAAIEPLPERGNGGTIESSAVGEPDEQLAPVGGTATSPVPPANPLRNRPENSSNSGSNPAGAAGGGSSTTLPNSAIRDTRSTPVPAPPAPATGSTGGAAGAAGSTGGVPKGATSPLPKSAASPAESASPPPRPELDAPTVPAPVPSPAGPGGALDFPSVDDAGRRSSYKPVVVPPLEPRARLAQNVLRGRVVSADTRLPEDGVEVILVDRLSRFSDRTTRTDASGRFALNIPEGDWSILLVMPSGRALPVEQGLVTASAGKVSDRWGRELTNLVLSR